MDGQFRLQFGDAASGGHKLGLFAAGRPGQSTDVDEVLTAPDVDRLLADTEVMAICLMDRPASTRSRTLRRNSAG
jgi:hypothetical protein